MSAPERFDAVVVGAGPAGSTAARNLALDGASVLLVDRRRFPRPKPCGGGLTPKAYRQLDFDISDIVRARHAGTILRGAGVPPFTIGDPRAEVWMVDRVAFDLRLVDQAVAAGVTFHDGESVVSVTDGGHSRVTTSSGVYSARLVVAADGSESPIARARGLRKDRDRRVVVALEAEAPGRSMTSNGPVIDFDIPGGYAWIFPKNDLLNVGLGTFDANAFLSLRARLSAFVDRSGVVFDEAPKIVGHRIPYGGHREPLHAGNVILVGDAAGLADGLFAEGIAYAIRSGRLAAAEAGRFVRGETADLARYTRRIHGTLLRDLRAWRALGQLIYRWPGVSMRLLRVSSRARDVAALAIAGDRSLSKVWSS